MGENLAILYTKNDPELPFERIIIENYKYLNFDLNKPMKKLIFIVNKNLRNKSFINFKSSNLLWFLIVILHCENLFLL